MEVEVEPPHVHPTGHRKLDLILPIAALFVSMLSIYLAWDNSKVMQGLVDQNERLVQANSLPHLSHSMRTLSGVDAGKVTFRLSNDGVGPAEIRFVEVKVDGRPVADVTALLERFGIPGGQLSITNVTNTMIRPGISVDYMDLTADPGIKSQVDDMIEAIQARRIAVRTCYCSVFEDCWVIAGGNSRPRPVAQCAAPPVPYE